ncbi:MAG: crotonase/enoyl-CoA hydratase family protein [Hyphomonadaceae bacterium]|nr:crotonase/enoyl-CoA hydratase family protein [Hyphomonadaceae bacterium]
MSDLIEFERRGAIAILRINRPDVRNAFDLAAAQAMEAALDAFDADADLRVGVLTGAGTAFSAGQDLKAAARGEFAQTEKRGGFGIMAAPPKKPLIAAVEGPALAGGFELALACDLIVASSASQFGLPEVKRSLVAVGGGALRLPHRVPHHIAMEMLLSGEPQSAEAMARWGVVNRVCAPGEALAAALALAETISANGPLAVIATKEIATRSRGENWSAAEGWTRQMEVVGPVLASEDFREGLLAFAQKRPPQWTGR